MAEGGDLVDVHLDDRLEWPGNMPVRTRAGGVDIGAESRHDAPLGRLDDVDAGRQPDDQQDPDDDSDGSRAEIPARQIESAATAGCTAAGGFVAPKEPAESLLKLSHDLVEVGRTLLAAALAAPRVFVTATWLVPGHSFSVCRIRLLCWFERRSRTKSANREKGAHRDCCAVRTLKPLDDLSRVPTKREDIKQRCNLNRAR